MMPSVQAADAARCPTRPPGRLRPVRPSILEPLLKQEPWLGPCCCMPNLLVLYVENRPVSLIAATPFDHAGLESRLFYLRTHYPRKAERAGKKRTRRPA